MLLSIARQTYLNSHRHLRTCVARPKHPLGARVRWPIIYAALCRQLLEGYWSLHVTDAPEDRKHYVVMIVLCEIFDLFQVRPQDARVFPVVYFPVD